MRILIAEDDMAGRKLLQIYLSKYGTCDIAVNGLETLDTFLSAINEEKPLWELMIWDVKLMHGSQLTLPDSRRF